MRLPRTVAYSLSSKKYIFLKYIELINFSTTKQLKKNSEDEQKSTWLHPKTGQPVSTMVIPPLEGKYRERMREKQKKILL